MYIVIGCELCRYFASFKAEGGHLEGDKFPCNDVLLSEKSFFFRVLSFMCQKPIRENAGNWWRSFDLCMQGFSLSVMHASNSI